jgi:ankyrin repeat protein
MNCPICYEEYQEDTKAEKYPVLVAPCSHNVCKSCFLDHKEHDDKCPVCRSGNMYEEPTRNVDLLKAIQIISFSNEMASSLGVTKEKKFTFNGKTQLYYNLYNKGKIDLNETDIHDNTLLMSASYEGTTSIIEELLKKDDCVLDTINNNGNTVLIHLCQNGLQDLVITFLELVEKRGIEYSFDHINKDGETAFVISCKGGKDMKKVTDLLYDKECELDIKDKSGNTPFIWAVRHGNYDFATKILSNEKYSDKAFLSASNGQGFSALLFMCKKYFTTAVTHDIPAVDVAFCEMLIDSMTDGFTGKLASGETAFMAFAWVYPDLAMKILNKYIQAVNKKKSDKEAGASESKEEFDELIVDSDLLKFYGIDGINDHESSALLFACSKNYEQLAFMLLKLIPTLQKSTSYTALLGAIKHKNPKLAVALLGTDCHPTFQSNQNGNAFALAGATVHELEQELTELRAVVSKQKTDITKLQTEIETTEQTEEKIEENAVNAPEPILNPEDIPIEIEGGDEEVAVADADEEVAVADADEEVAVADGDEEVEDDSEDDEVVVEEVAVPRDMEKEMNDLIVSLSTNETKIISLGECIKDMKDIYERLYEIFITDNEIINTNYLSILDVAITKRHYHIVSKILENQYEVRAGREKKMIRQFQQMVELAQTDYAIVQSCLGDSSW